jgi:hypothetical protein
MSKSLDFYIGKLPPYIGNEIFKFIIPEKENIVFLNYYFGGYDSNYNYNKYDVGFINNKKIKKNGLFLSRIKKKNGKHRYYLTIESFTSECDSCGEKNCRSDYCGRLIYMYNFQSKYVGKNLDIALLELYCNSKIFMIKN